MAWGPMGLGRAWLKLGHCCADLSALVTSLNCGRRRLPQMSVEPQSQNLSTHALGTTMKGWMETTDCEEGEEQTRRLRESRVEFGLGDEGSKLRVIRYRQMEAGRGDYPMEDLKSDLQSWPDSGLIFHFHSPLTRTPVSQEFCWR